MLSDDTGEIIRVEEGMKGNDDGEVDTKSGCEGGMRFPVLVIAISIGILVFLGPSSFAITVTISLSSVSNSKFVQICTNELSDKAKSTYQYVQVFLFH